MIGSSLKLKAAAAENSDNLGFVIHQEHFTTYKNEFNFWDDTLCIVDRDCYLCVIFQVLYRTLVILCDAH